MHQLDFEGRPAPPGGGEHFVWGHGVELVETVVNDDLGFHAASGVPASVRSG
jgi:hypothetical protein